MSPELDALLCQRYPQIFADRHADMQTTCMCWGFSCGDGWFQLIDTLCAKLQRMTDEDGAPQIIAVQVKEKFGELRFYVRQASEAQFALIDEAEQRSAQICEVCGAPGRVVVDGWVRTCCPRHTPDGALTLAQFEAARQAKQARKAKP